MLNELETLSANIGRLIDINRREHEARTALSAELAQLHAQYDAARAELEQVRHERNTLQADRDTLAARIDDAQVRLNAILEKLPHTKNTAAPENQFDLLEPDPDAPANNGDSHTAHGENA